MLKKSLFCAGLLIAGSLLAADYTREEYTSLMEIGKRPRRTPHTLIFARFQPYDLRGNFRDEWYDRPLIVNSNWRKEKSGVKASWNKEADWIRMYEIAGITLLGNAYSSFFHDMLKASKQADFSGFSLMAGVGVSRGMFNRKTASGERRYQRFLRNVREAAGSDKVLRIDGKIPLFNYGGFSDSDLLMIRKEMKKRKLAEVHLFTPLWLNVYSEYNSTGKLSEKTLEKIEKQIRERLDLYDGVNFTNLSYKRNLNGDDVLAKVFYPELDKKYLAPLFAKIWSDPKYRHKLLGFNVDHGYIGDIDNGVVQAEQGTSVLRRQLDTQLLFNPDIISMAEWNEVNENTSFQPTLTNSKSIMRIMRYYARFVKGLKPAPLAGDDLSLPDLIVSVRWGLQAGEEYRIELLNVPDTPEEGKYQVKLLLTDENGRVLRRMPADSFRQNKLTSVTYKVGIKPLFSKVRAILPVLEINYKGKKFTFKPAVYTRLFASTPNNAKELRLPLRDQYVPEKFQWRFSGSEKGVFAVSAVLSGKEKLHSMELLDGKFPVLSAWNDREFDQSRYYWVTVRNHRRIEGSYPLKIRVKNSPEFIWRPWGRPYCATPELEKKSDHWFVQEKCLFWHSGPAGILGIPKKDKNAVIECVIGDFPAIRLSLAKLIREKYWTEEPGNCIMTEFELRPELIDHPAPLGSKEVRLSGMFESKANDPALTILAVTESGKIFRSAPRFFKKIKKCIPLDVFDERAGKAVKVNVPDFQVPEIVYEFDSARGNKLESALAREFTATLGGGTSRGMALRFGMNFPAGQKRMAPVWTKDGKSDVLKFGNGTYLHFPSGIFPNGAFTLQMRFKTLSSADQWLFHNGFSRQAGIGAAIIGGKLFCSYASGSTGFGHSLNRLPTTLKVVPGVWHNLEIAYDLNNMQIKLDGEKIVFPFKLRPAWTAPSLFGCTFNFPGSGAGFAKPQPFDGFLSKLRIKHSADIKIEQPKVKEVIL